MVYRIRYFNERQQAGETVVEANTPTEAMVKFCQTLPDGRSNPSTGQRITSVSLESPDPDIEPDLATPDPVF